MSEEGIELLTHAELLKEHKDLIKYRTFLQEKVIKVSRELDAAIAARDKWWHKARAYKGWARRFKRERDEARHILKRERGGRP